MDDKCISVGRASLNAVLLEKQPFSVSLRKFEKFSVVIESVVFVKLLFAGAKR